MLAEGSGYTPRRVSMLHSFVQSCGTAASATGKESTIIAHSGALQAVGSSLDCNGVSRIVFRPARPLDRRHAARLSKTLASVPRLMIDVVAGNPVKAVEIGCDDGAGSTSSALLMPERAR